MRSRSSCSIWAGELRAHPVSLCPTKADRGADCSRSSVSPAMCPDVCRSAVRRDGALKPLVGKWAELLRLRRLADARCLSRRAISYRVATRPDPLGCLARPLPGRCERYLHHSAQSQFAALAVPRPDECPAACKTLLDNQIKPAAIRVSAWTKAPNLSVSQSVDSTPHQKLPYPEHMGASPLAVPQSLPPFRSALGRAELSRREPSIDEGPTASSHHAVSVGHRGTMGE